MMKAANVGRNDRLDLRKERLDSESIEWSAKWICLDQLD